MKKIHNTNSTIITLNKKAYYNFFISEEIEAGLALQGWEVKALRAGKVNISGSYILFKNSEAYLFGTIIPPLNVACSYVLYDPMRTRKLLLNKREFNSIFSKMNRQGYTVVALSIYWKNAWCKVKIGIAKGKKEYDKRHNIKCREWKLDKMKIIKKHRYLST